MSSLYLTSSLIQTLRPVRVPSNQNTRWHSIFYFWKEIRILCSFPITIKIPTQEDDHHNVAYIRYNSDSTKDIPWTKLCSFVWLLCFVFWSVHFYSFYDLFFNTFLSIILSTCILFMLYFSLYIAHAFVYWIWINAPCITCSNFLKYT
jgi:hypothetical protein